MMKTIVAAGVALTMMNGVALGSSFVEGYMRSQAQQTGDYRALNAYQAQRVYEQQQTLMRQQQEWLRRQQMQQQRPVHCQSYSDGSVQCW